jgi:RHS repeat-associated protein
LIARYVHGEGIDEILRREAGASTVFYHHDALGSTIALTDASGALVEQYRYDIYGLPTIMDASGSDLGSRTSAFGNRFMFTGREWLSDLAVFDYRHRAYSPVLGRWLQPDPIGFAAGDVNLYRYCANGILRFVDPFGLYGDFANPDAAAVGGNAEVNRRQSAIVGPRVEYGFEIYRNSNGTYGYNEPRPYTGSSAEPLIYKDPKTGRLTTKTETGRTVPVDGAAHTHHRAPATPSEPGDTDTANSLADAGIPSYVGNTWGDVNKFCPKKRKWEPIAREAR